MEITDSYSLEKNKMPKTPINITSKHLDDVLVRYKSFYINDQLRNIDEIVQNISNILDSFTDEFMNHPGGVYSYYPNIPENQPILESFRNTFKLIVIKNILPKLFTDYQEEDLRINAFNEEYINYQQELQNNGLTQKEIDLIKHDMDIAKSRRDIFLQNKNLIRQIMIHLLTEQENLENKVDKFVESFSNATIEIVTESNPLLMTHEGGKKRKNTKTGKSHKTRKTGKNIKKRLRKTRRNK
jgi:hypothetical protein